MGKHRPTSQRRGPDTWRPSDRTSGRGLDIGRNNDREQSSDGDRNPIPTREEARRLGPVRSAVTKSTRERRNNPSSRIHSLRNLLARDTKLPMTVRQEKERELAALLLDQKKAEVIKNARSNLQRYHFVRFMERQKATRALNKLVKLRKSPSYKDEYKTKLEKMIHEAEVDVAYTQYAPLGEKYISLFVGGEKKEKGMNKKDYAILDSTQRDELRAFSDDVAQIIRSASGTRPPMWYEVEKYMGEGEDKLNALRDGKLTVQKVDKELVSVGGKEQAALRKLHQHKTEAKPSWLDDDGMIDPADLDSEDEQQGDIQIKRNDDDSDGDEDMADGGFFER
ncbi:rRNA-processing protein efg1 [Knufia peltigerae]|uniref:rRNA-processing protein EFG1 n=1 Tax=Knufia peltigerae TaxID=1002370 RepID=A0AA39D006_9EURO|nr:rRNA-processing protein efg1 [Knufia peltigerae]